MSFISSGFILSLCGLSFSAISIYLLFSGKTDGSSYSHVRYGVVTQDSSAEKK
jgi:hypothetical protein